MGKTYSLQTTPYSFSASEPPTCALDIPWGISYLNSDCGTDAFPCPVAVPVNKDGSMSIACGSLLTIGLDRDLNLKLARNIRGIVVRGDHLLDKVMGLSRAGYRNLCPYLCAASEGSDHTGDPIQCLADPAECPHGTPLSEIFPDGLIDYSSTKLGTLPLGYAFFDDQTSFKTVSGHLALTSGTSGAVVTPRKLPLAKPYAPSEGSIGSCAPDSPITFDDAAAPQDCGVDAKNPCAMQIVRFHEFFPSMSRKDMCGKCYEVAFHSRGLKDEDLCHGGRCPSYVVRKVFKIIDIWPLANTRPSDAAVHPTFGAWRQVCPYTCARGEAGNWGVSPCVEDPSTCIHGVARPLPIVGKGVEWPAFEVPGSAYAMPMEVTDLQEIPCVA